MNSVIYVSNSKNRKLGKNVDCTYAPIEESCPKSCSLKNNGCYALYGYVGMVVNRLSKKNKNKMTPLQVAKEEAQAIKNSHNGGQISGNFLRLHVSGDARTRAAVSVLARAVRAWQSRGGALAWSYTHAWRSVPRADWQQISTLASIDDFSEAKDAKKQGYVPAIVVSHFENDKSFIKDDTKWIPCPAQTKENVTCSSCKLCLNDKKLKALNAGIAFAAHGVSKNKIIKRLNVIK